MRIDFKRPTSTANESRRLKASSATIEIEDHSYIRTPLVQENQLWRTTFIGDHNHEVQLKPKK